MMPSSALVLLDLQNDFLHSDGAYGRAGQSSPDIVALPARLKPLVELFHNKGAPVGATLFTLVPGREGEPMISPHLKKMRPFLTRGDFAPGGWGQAVVDELQPVDFSVEKIAFSAFYMTRLEWVLRRLGVEKVYFAGIVTNGGVASTVRDAHVQDFECIVLEDGCAAFSSDLHRAAIEGLRPVARIATIAEVMQELAAA
jgi:ureidoacrylate peracid hydrolase